MTTHKRHAARNGSVYVLVLVLGIILTVVGLSAVAISRASTRAINDGGDWYEARGLAFSGVEHAMARMNANPNWRAAYAGQTVQGSLGHGGFSWQLVDEIDGNLGNNANQAFAIYSTGTVRNASYCLRVHMSPLGTQLTSGLSTPGGVSLNGASIDSFDSSLGAYGGTNVSSQAKVATNSVTAGAVSLAAASGIAGSVAVGVGGNPLTVVTKDGSSTISGGASALTDPQTFSTPSAPATGASLGWRTYTGNQNDTISTDLHLTALEIKSNAVVQIQGNVTIVVDQDVTIWNKTGLTILPNSSLKLYFKGNLSIAKNAAGSVAGPNLTRMQYISLGTGTVDLTDGSSAQGVIISPNGPVNLSGNFQFSGAIVAKSVTMTTGADFHEDKRITSGADPLILGGGSVPKPDGWSQVVR